MNRDNVLQPASSRPEFDAGMTKRSDQELETSRAIKAAKAFVGEHDGPMTEEEAAAADEMRRRLPRPSQDELKAIAKKLARPATKD